MVFAFHPEHAVDKLLAEARAADAMARKLSSDKGLHERLAHVFLPMSWTNDRDNLEQHLEGLRASLIFSLCDFDKWLKENPADDWPTYANLAWHRIIQHFRSYPPEQALVDNVDETMNRLHAVQPLQDPWTLLASYGVQQVEVADWADEPEPVFDLNASDSSEVEEVEVEVVDETPRQGERFKRARY